MATANDVEREHWLARLGEARVVLELLSTANSSGRPPAPNGAGRSALLIPGLLASERSLNPLAGWLEASGWRVLRAGVGLNLDCSQLQLDRIAERVEEGLDHDGERAVAIGQSRGGQLGRALAVQRPDLVAASIALGSPVPESLAVRPATVRQLQILATLGSLGVPGFLRHECEHGPCCERFRAALLQAPPPGVELVALWSPSDGVVDPSACLDPHADCREVESSHIGMAFNGGVWRELAFALAKLGSAQPQPL